MSFRHEDWNDLSVRMKERLIFHKSLASITTIGVGGNALIYAKPDNIDELKQLLACCKKNNVIYFPVGAGSNLIFHDDGFKGLIIKLGGAFKYVEQLEGKLIKAGAAFASSALLRWSITKGLSGLEVLAGIPCTIGGAVAMNAGAGGSVGSCVKAIHYIDANGIEKIISNDLLSFSYRSLKGLGRGAIITSVELELKEGNKDLIERCVNQSLKRRLKSQPKGKSAGCIFKNPDGQSAGRLIDECGLKGLTVGGAKVSEIHANFIINKGGAKSLDIKELIKIIQRTIWEKRGIKLETEVNLLD